MAVVLRQERATGVPG